MQHNADATRQDEKKPVITVEVPTHWTALNGDGLPYLDATWHDTNPPTELLSLSNDANLPPKLVEIINWSLQRPNFSAPTSAGDVKQQIDLRSGASSTPHRPDEVNTRSSLAGGRRPVSLERKLLERKFPVLKSAKADVKLAIDRVKTLKQKHDLERAISTRQVQDAKCKIRPVLVECISCFDEFPTSDLVRVPCNHNYCKHCLSVLVITALQNESAFPPKCCLTEIPPQTIIISLNSKQRELYKEKAAEYSIPANRRWYCPNTACTKWIPPNKLQPDRTMPQKCSHCNTKICSICRGIAHKKGDCPQDFGLQETLDIAELEGWKRCYSCRTLVERRGGCRHITCKCGAQFCYICGKKWQTCHCTEADLANRQAALRRNRAERSAAEEHEIQEVARAIAAVEQIAREDEERRLQQEAQRALELQREQAELARLEQIRLQEEQQRQRDEEEAERQLHEALRLSIKDEADAILQALKDMIYHQHLSLDERHRHQEQQLHDQFEQQKGSQALSAKQLQANIDHNIMERKERLKVKQDSELQALTRKHQFEEDDIFLQIQLYLKDKPNREIREKRMYYELAKHQEDACQSLRVKHQTELEKLDKTANMEREGIMRSQRAREKLDEEQHHRKLKKLHHAVATERKWFVTVQNRRKEMVHEHNRLVLQAFNSGVDAVGLTEELAARISPLSSQELTDDGSSSLQQTPVEFEAPVPSSMSLKPARKPLKDINQVLKHLNQAPPSPTDSFITAYEGSLGSFERAATKSHSKQNSLGNPSSTFATPAVNWPLPMPTTHNTNANLGMKTGELRKPPSAPILTKVPLIRTPLTPPKSPPSPLIPDPAARSPLPKSKPLSPLANRTLQATTTSRQRLKNNLPRLDIPAANRAFHPIPPTVSSSSSYSYSSASLVPAPLSVASTQYVSPPPPPQHPPPPRPYYPPVIASHKKVPRKLPSINLGNPIFIDGLTAEYSYQQQQQYK